MIISHQHKYIFIKTKKTAGTSIEISLSRYCERDDIITPIYPLEDEAIRASFGKKPQNYKHHINKNNGDEVFEFFNHISAGEIKEIIGGDIWNSYFKICFERNPWDKVISAYYFALGVQSIADNTSFDEFIDSYLHIPYNYDLYTINNEVVVDHICLYENLNEELMSFCNKVQIPFDGWLPRAKGSYRKTKTSYREMYTSMQKASVEKYFEKELSLLKYEF